MGRRRCRRRGPAGPPGRPPPRPGRRDQRRCGAQREGAAAGADQPAQVDLRPQRGHRGAEQQGGDRLDRGQQRVGQHARRPHGHRHDEPDHEQRHERRPSGARPAPLQRGARPPRDPDPRDQRREQHHARELRDHGDRQRRGGHGAGRRDHLRDLVHRHPRPQPGGPVGEPERGGGERHPDDREAAVHGDQRDRGGDLLLVGVGDGAHRGDRGGAADREPGGDQQGQRAPDPEPGPEPPRRREGHRHRDQQHRGLGDAQPQQVADRQLQPQQHDARTQHPPAGPGEPGLERRRQQPRGPRDRPEQDRDQQPGEHGDGAGEREARRGDADRDQHARQQHGQERARPGGGGAAGDGGDGLRHPATIRDAAARRNARCPRTL
ncbi:hypothetical protein CHMI_01168 [Cellulomonas hominis]|nr:hypothetical protein CHMI_01168 [Cellulomonas hominis]